MHRASFKFQILRLAKVGLLPTAYCLILLTAFCLPPTANGQSTGAVKGKVKNINGDGIGNATITARLGGKDVRTTRSNNKGDFLLDGLDAGTYNIVFDARGYGAGVKYSVEIKSGKTKDLGGNLILLIDRGTQVIVNGSVYYKDGTSLAGAEVRIERINSDGSVRKMSTGYTSESGEFTFRQPEGKAKFRITATHKGVSATKEVEVDAAAVYRLAISLELDREKQNL